MTLRLALLLLAAAAPALADSQPKLLALPSKPFAWEKAGTMILLHCPPKWDDCGDFESLAPQLTPDWEPLRAKAAAAARKNEPTAGDAEAEAVVVDQYGGAWKVRLLAAGAGSEVPKFAAPFEVEFTPSFPGYEVTGAGKDAKVDVLANKTQWDDARKELGLDKPKKKGLGALFGE